MSAPWQVIKDRLVAEGDMTERNVTRTPKPRVCRSCGRDVIAAITDSGFEVAVEATATTVLGELQTIATSGETYALLDHGEMVRRTQHRIAYRSADEERTHAKHRCGRPPPEASTRFTTATKRRTTFDGPIPY